MGPSKERGAGTRPPPLRIHRDSHPIRKAHSPPPPWPSSSTSSFFIPAASSGRNNSQQQRQQRQPLIIYTHSPKVIHTQPRDFMALVQKLTGMSRSNDVGGGPARPEPVQPLRAAGALSNCDSEDSSSTSEEEAPGGQLPAPAPAVSPPVLFDASCSNRFLADVPIFTPTAGDLFCSPRHYYRCPDARVSPSNMGNSMSPSVMELVTRTFHDY